MYTEMVYCETVHTLAGVQQLCIYAVLVLTSSARYNSWTNNNICMWQMCCHFTVIQSQ